MPNIFAARERDTRWDPVIEAGLKYPYRTYHVAGAADTEDEAREAAAGIYRARRHFKVGCKSGYEADGRGRFTVWFVLFDLNEAKRYIAAKAARGEQLAYNVLRGN